MKQRHVPICQPNLTATKYWPDKRATSGKTNNDKKNAHENDLNLHFLSEKAYPNDIEKNTLATTEKDVTINVIRRALPYPSWNANLKFSQCASNLEYVTPNFFGYHNIELEFTIDHCLSVNDCEIIK